MFTRKTQPQIQDSHFLIHQINRKSQPPLISLLKHKNSTAQWGKLNHSSLLKHTHTNSSTHFLTPSTQQEIWTPTHTIIHKNTHLQNQELVPSPDVSLLNQNTGMMDRLGQTQLEHLGLQAAFQEVLGLETQHVIKLHAPFLQHAGPHQTTQQSIAW